MVPPAVLLRRGRTRRTREANCRGAKWMAPSGRGPVQSAEEGRQPGVHVHPRRKRRKEAERGRKKLGENYVTKKVEGPPEEQKRGGGMATLRPRLMRQQLAAAATQLRRAGGRSPQRVCALASQALETSATNPSRKRTWTTPEVWECPWHQEYERAA